MKKSIRAAATRTFWQRDQLWHGLLPARQRRGQRDGSVSRANPLDRRNKMLRMI